MAGNYAPNYYGGGSSVVVAGSGCCGTPAYEQTLFVGVVPANSFGRDGDQAYITSGDLEGAIYERQSDVWTFISNYTLADRQTNPDTDILPVGFRWILVNQTPSGNNGTWMWNGSSAVQLP